MQDSNPAPKPLDTKKTYLFNPHRHVKIWLSADKDKFLNDENQLRLVKMRANNPNDTIHLVYSETLLSETARSDLLQFCKKHRITPVSVEQDIIPYANTPNEKKLIELYQREIAAKEEGNLAAASDILRWLKPVYSRGTYHDFDAPIDTKNTSPLKVVQEPILLNIGSWTSTDGIEGIYLNNDIISVVDADDASEKIECIQNYIIQMHNSPTRFRDLHDRLLHDASITNSILENWQQNPDFHFIEILSDIESRLLPEENLTNFRKKILEITSSDAIFLQTLSKWSIPDKPFGNDITLARERLRTVLLRITVQYITGPAAVHASFKTYQSFAEVEQNAGYSYSRNQLDAFSSGQSIGLHAKPEALLKLQLNNTEQTRNDASWLDSGKAKIKAREASYHAGAQTLQRFFKSIDSRKSTKTKQDNTQSSQSKP